MPVVTLSSRLPRWSNLSSWRLSGSAALCRERVSCLIPLPSERTLPEASV